MANNQANPPSPDIQVSLFETFMRRLFSIKRSGLLSGIHPMVQLGVSPADFPDFPYLAGIRLWLTSAHLNPGAGNTQFVGILNPVGSGMLVVVESCRFTTLTQNVLSAISLRLADQSTLAGFATSQVGPRDGRLAKTLAPAPLLGTQLWSAADPGGFSGNGYTIIDPTNTPVGTSMVIDRPVVLSPGQALGCRNATVAELTNFSAMGYERTLEKSEQ